MGHFSIFFPPEDAASKPDRLLAEAAQNGRATDEGWRVRKDGSRFWANVIVHRLVDDAGRLAGFVKMTRDETQRRSLEAALREIEAFRDYEYLAGELSREVVNRIFRASLTLAGAVTAGHRSEHHHEDRRRPQRPRPGHPPPPGDRLPLRARRRSSRPARRIAMGPPPVARQGPHSVVRA